MDLIEKYLAAVRWNIAPAKADDIVAELRDVIETRIEEREDALDRPLTQDEVSAVLKDFGHPLVVAARYGTHQYLIGPDLFPFYFFSLKVFVGIGALILIVSGAADLIFGGANPARAFAHLLNDGWTTLLSYAGLVTLIFAVIERTGWLRDKLDQWTPEKLPDFSDLRLKPKKIWERAFETIVSGVFVLWLAGVVHFPYFYSSAKGIRVDPAPVWFHYYWPILALAAGGFLLNLIRLVRPDWLKVQAAMGVALAAGAVALLALIYQAGSWVVVTSTGADPKQVADIAESLTLAIRISIVVVGIIWTLNAAGALWRLYRK